MVRETRNLWVGHLPETVREERIREHFKRSTEDVSPPSFEQRGSGYYERSSRLVTETDQYIRRPSSYHAGEIRGRTRDRLYRNGPYSSSLIERPTSVNHRVPSWYDTSPTGASSSSISASGQSPASRNVYGNVASAVVQPHESCTSNSNNYNECHLIKNKKKSRSGSESPCGSTSGSILITSSNNSCTNINATSSHTSNLSNHIVDRGNGGSASSSRSHSRSPSSYSSTNSTSSNSHASSPVSGSDPPLSSSSSTRTRNLQSAVSAASQSGGSTSSSTGANGTNSTGNPVVHSEDNRPLAIRVRNLPARSSDTSLKDGLFHEYKKHGKVTWVKVVGQNAERYALVCFKKPDDVDKALEVSHDKLFFGCKIEVEPYQGYDVEDNEFRPYEAELDEYHPKSTRTLFIGNLEKDITGSELRKHFECFGEIIEIDIKKQGMNAYAFCQYSDIVSVVKAMRKMDGEHLGNNRIKLGFGKSMPTNCVWIDGIADSVSENHLSGQFSRYGPISQVIIDRERKLALVSFEQIQYAQTAVKEMRGATVRGRKLQVDFASKECKEAFYEKLDKHNSDEPGISSSSGASANNNKTICSVVVPGARFGRYESQSRSRASSFSRHGNSTGAVSPSNNSCGSSSGVSPALGSSTTPSATSCSSSGPSANSATTSVTATVSNAATGSTTPRGSRSRSSRHEYEYADRRFRNYDEYSQGSATSHDEETYNYQKLDSPQSRLAPCGSSVIDAVDISNTNNGRRRCDKSPGKPKGDIRILQKERFHLLEQLEECPSSGDELVSPKKRMKYDHSSHHHNHHHTLSSLQSHPNDCVSNNTSCNITPIQIGDSICDVLSNHSSNDTNSNANHLRKTCVEVRRLSECNSLKLQQQQQMQQQLSAVNSINNSRRPSIDTSALTSTCGSSNSSTLNSIGLRHSYLTNSSNLMQGGGHDSSSTLHVYGTTHTLPCKRRRVGVSSGLLGNQMSATSSLAQSDINEYHTSRGRGHQLHSHHSHEASGGESADGSRPGTPLCDERPEVLPTEPRRAPRDRPQEPMMLPLPKFGVQFFQQHRSSTSASAAGSSLTGQMYSSISTFSSSTSLSFTNICSSNNINLTNSSTLLNSGSHSSLSNTLSSPPPLIVGTRMLPSSSLHAHYHHNAQQAGNSQLSSSTAIHHPSPLRPRSLSSNSSDSELGQTGTSPSLEERIRTLDEMYERWSGGGSVSSRTHNSTEITSALSTTPNYLPHHTLHSQHINHPHNTTPFSARHISFLDLDVNELPPSDIVKSVLAKKSIFDDDLQRLKNINDKYEPSDFANAAKVSMNVSATPGIPNLAATKTAVVGCTSAAKPAVFQPPSVNILQKVNASPLNSPQASISPYSSPSPSPVVVMVGNKHPVNSQTIAVPQPAKGLQYPFPSHPPLLNALPTSTCSTLLTSVNTVTDTSKPATETIKPKNSPITKSMSVPCEKSATVTVSSSSTTINTNRSLSKSNSSPGILPKAASAPPPPSVSGAIIKSEDEAKISKQSSSSAINNKKKKSKSERSSDKKKIGSEREEEKDEKVVEQEKEAKAQKDKEKEKQIKEKERLEKEKWDREQKRREIEVKEKQDQDHEEKERKDREEKERNSLEENNDLKEQKEEEFKEHEVKNRIELEEAQTGQQPEKEREIEEKEELQRKAREERETEECINQELKEDQAIQRKEPTSSVGEHLSNIKDCSSSRKEDTPFHEEEMIGQHSLFNEELFVQSHNLSRKSSGTSPIRQTKRRLSSQDSNENEDHAKRVRISGEARKSIDRRDFKDHNRKHHKIHNVTKSLEEKLMNSDEHRYRKDSGFDEKKVKDHKKYDKSRSTEKNLPLNSSAPNKYHKRTSVRDDVIMDISSEKEDDFKSAENSLENNEEHTELPSSDEEETGVHHQHRQMKHKIKRDHKEKKRMENEESDINRRSHFEKKHELERKHSRSEEHIHQHMKSSFSSGSGGSLKDKQTLSRKMSDTSDSDSDEPKKHSIFEIHDEGPYISMYDKVKARSCKNMQKQEEEKKIKAKFSQLKQCRAKREEKKRSTSYDGDSDSDFEERQHKYRSFKSSRDFASSSDESLCANHRREGLLTDSDSDIQRKHYNRSRLNELCDSSEDDLNIGSNVSNSSTYCKQISSKRNSRIASESSNDEMDKTTMRSSENEIKFKHEIKKEAEGDSCEGDVDEKYLPNPQKNEEHFSELKSETIKIEFDSNIPIKSQVKTELSDMSSLEFFENKPELSEIDNGHHHDDFMFSHESRKKHKKNKKRQKSPVPSDTDNQGQIEKVDNSFAEKNSPSLEDVFDELKRETVLSSHATSTPSASDKKKHKDRKEKKREKNRSDEYDKSMSKEERHRLKKAKKTKNHESSRYPPFVQAPKRTGEKIEDIFGPISDEESQNSTAETPNKELMFDDHLPCHNQQPMVSAALNPYKQEPLTPKSHTVEENEENKQKASSHIERERHRKEKREKKRKDREKSREQHALSSLQHKIDDENSVDLDEAGRALEAQLMEDSDNKVNDEPNVSSATTMRSDVTDVFRFSDGDENSIEVVVADKKDSHEHHKNRDKKKKKKKSKEERHQRRENHHCQNPSSKLSIDVNLPGNLSSDDIKQPISKPSPSLPCLLDEVDSQKNAPMDLLISPINREKTIISPIPKTPTLATNIKPNVECKKKPEKFIPGFDRELDDKISQSAVQSISAEFNSPANESVQVEVKIPLNSPTGPKHLDKIEEKSRVIISQEETEDAVAALLGESFGSCSVVDYLFTDDPCEVPPEEEMPAHIPDVPVIAEEEAEEMRKAVQSLSNEEIDIKADTPTSENDLQIDTDTEEVEEDVPQTKFEAVLKSPEHSLETKDHEPLSMEPPPINVNKISLISDKLVDGKNIVNNDVENNDTEIVDNVLKTNLESNQSVLSQKDVATEKAKLSVQRSPHTLTTTVPTASLSSVLATKPTQSRLVGQSQNNPMQPPTITIPDQTLFIYPPVNVMVSPRSSKSSQSPHQQQSLLQTQEMSPVGSQLMNVRGPSQLSPGINRGHNHSHTSPQMTSVVPQHVVIQQRQLMSPTSATASQISPQTHMNPVSTTTLLSPVIKQAGPLPVAQIKQDHTNHQNLTTQTMNKSGLDQGQHLQVLIPSQPSVKQGQQIQGPQTHQIPQRLSPQQISAQQQQFMQQQQIIQHRQMQHQRQLQAQQIQHQAQLLHLQKMQHQSALVSQSGQPQRSSSTQPLTQSATFAPQTLPANKEQTPTSPAGMIPNVPNNDIHQNILIVRHAQHQSHIAQLPTTVSKNVQSASHLGQSTTVLPIVHGQTTPSEVLVKSSESHVIEISKNEVAKATHAVLEESIANESHRSESQIENKNLITTSVPTAAIGHLGATIVKEQELISVIKSQSAVTPVEMKLQTSGESVAQPKDQKIQQESRDDKDFCSAKEINLESVIKKVEVLCSADDDKYNPSKLTTSENPNEEFDKNHSLITTSSIEENPNRDPSIQSEVSEDTHDEEEIEDDASGKTSRGNKKGRTVKAGRKSSAISPVTVSSSSSVTISSIDETTSEGITTRRGKVVHSGRGRKGRPSTKSLPTIPAIGEKKMVDQDVYEFREDSGEENFNKNVGERQRLILTIKSPVQVAAALVKTPTEKLTAQEDVSKVIPPSIIPAIGGEDNKESELSVDTSPSSPFDSSTCSSKCEDFATPQAAANTRKSRRLLEKDRSTIDDIIEDVVRNVNPLKDGQTPPRRSTRNSQSICISSPKISTPPQLLSAEKPGQVASNDVRKSPRANRRTKNRTLSDTSLDSSDEKVLTVKLNEKDEVTVKPVSDALENEPKQDVNKPQSTKVAPVITSEPIKSAKDSLEPLTLIDPVTGIMTVVTQSKEGQYVPMQGSRQQPLIKVPPSPVPVSTTSTAQVIPSTTTATETKTSADAEHKQLVQPAVQSNSHTASVKTTGEIKPPISVTTNIVHTNKPVSVVVSVPQPIKPNKPSHVLHQQQQQQQQLPPPQPIILQTQSAQMQPQHTTVRAHSLKAHVLNSQLKSQPQPTQLQHHTVVSQIVKVSNSSTQPITDVPAVVISNPGSQVIQSRHINPTASQQASTIIQSQHMTQSTINNAGIQHSNLLINIPQNNTPHGSVHSPRVQQNLVMKQTQQQQPLPAHQQNSQQHIQVHPNQQIVHVVSKQQPQLMQSQPHHQHHPVVMHGKQLPHSQSQYNNPVAQSSGKAIQQGAQSSQPLNKQLNSNPIQIPMPHGIQHKQTAQGVSVVTHQQLVKQVQHMSPQPQSQTQQQQQVQQSQLPQHMQQQIQQQVKHQQLCSGQQQVIAHAHQASNPYQQPTGATLLQVKSGHQQQLPPPSVKGVVGLHQGQQIMTGAVASPPLKQPNMASQQPVVTGARAAVPSISPQGQQRGHIMQPGLPVAAFEANMHDIGNYNSARSQSPPPAHQQASPLAPADGAFAADALRGVSREHLNLYQQYLRDAINNSARIPYIPRSPHLPGTDLKELADLDETMAGSPPLELRRPSSGPPRTVAVPHSLQSPQDRATDSPQVAQVYLHGTRIPHPHYPDVSGRFYENIRPLQAEPPPAHRTSHSVVTQPPSGYVAQSAGPTNLAHAHAKVLDREREQREREREQREREIRERELREREKERSSLPGHTSMPSHGSLVPVLPTPAGRNLQVATPPHASQVPPQADSLLTLLQRYPVMWQGLLALKTDQAAVQMHFVFGNPHVARGSLPCNSDGSTPPLRIAQRMRLEQTQLDGVAKKMQFENEHCMLLALPCGRDHMDVLQQSRNLQTGFITYLQQKMAAGIVNIPVPGSEQAAYVVHIFPSCEFANENLERAAPDLKHRVAEIAHLLIVIATV